jgi:hypothetical protein
MTYTAKAAIRMVVTLAALLMISVRFKKITAHAA